MEFIWAKHTLKGISAISSLFQHKLAFFDDYLLDASTYQLEQLRKKSRNEKKLIALYFLLVRISKRHSPSGMTVTYNSLIWLITRRTNETSYFDLNLDNCCVENLIGDKRSWVF